jgi:predicted alpha/beta hydrolase
MTQQDLTISSGSYCLPARLYLPDTTPQVAYVLHPATGVPASYYAQFAAWVAAQGHAILTYDYRADASPKHSRIKMSDWGIEDQNAALNCLIDHFPTAQIRVIGHSLGGFMTMFHEQAHRIASLSAVCSGPAYWKRTPFPQVIGAFGFWQILGPIATAINGYLPARLLGASAPTPPEAFHQWRIWCGNPELHRGQWGNQLPWPDLDRFNGRLNMIGVSDDWMIPPSVVADLVRFYPRAVAEFHTVTPQQAGCKSIGHMAIFRPRAAAHWPKLL